MSDATWVMAASAAAWLGIGFYLLHLSRKNARLEERLAELEREMGKNRSTGYSDTGEANAE